MTTSTTLRVLTPQSRPSPPLPRWSFISFAVAAIFASLHKQLGGGVLDMLEVVSATVAMAGGCFLAAWLEESVYFRVHGRALPLRLLAMIAVIPAAPLLGLVAGGVFSLPLRLFHADSWVAPTFLLFTVWLAGAAIGSAVIVLIDFIASALVRDFRTRIVLAVVLLLGLIIAGAMSLSILAASVLDALRTGSGKILLGDIDISTDNPEEKEILQLLVNDPTLVAGGLFGITMLLGLPTFMSACGKMADAIMERIHPLTAALESVARKERNVRLEEGGSDDFKKVARSFNHMVEELALAEQMERAFGQYVSSKVLGRIKAQHGQAALPASMKDATVFFADIRGFTSMSEQLQPTQVVALLNRYFEHVVALVDEHDGYLNKFIGDAVVVVFNAPLDQGDHAQRAVNCAIALQKAVERLNGSGAFPEIGALKVGVGVATGPMVCGNIGSSRQMEYTVIGDTVNLAARLTGKAAAGEVWVSEQTAATLDASTGKTALEPIKVKGKELEVLPYRVWPI